MKIFIIPSWYPSLSNRPSGIFFAAWAKMLSNDGHEVIIVANILHSLKKLINYSRARILRLEAINDLGLTVYRHESVNLWPMMPTLSFRSYRRGLTGLFHRAVKEQGAPDVVLAMSSVWAGAAIAQETTRLGIPLIVSEHAKEFLLPDGWAPLHKKLISQTYAQASKVVGNSSAVEQRILADFSAASGKTVTIHNAVAAPTVGALPRPSTADEFRFIVVAFLRREKRHDLLLDAFTTIVKKHPKVHLTIVGGGRFINNIRHQIVARGLSDHAYLTGELPYDKVQVELAQSHALVLPSDVETFGMALVEGMSHGLPVIATRCGGPEDIVTESTGILISPGDAEALVASMSEMIVEYHRFNQQSIRDYAAEKFGPARYVEDFGRLFEEATHKA